MKRVLATASVFSLLMAGSALAQSGGATSGQPGAGADIKVQQPPAQVNVQQPAPHVSVQQPAPQVTVTQPKPEVTVNQPKPEVTVNQPKPDVTVTQPKPDVTVQHAKPDVTVNQQKPEVTVQQKVEPTAQKPGVNQTAPAGATRPLAADVQNLIGKEVYGENGNHVGDIKNLLIGPGDRVQAAVIEFGGFLGLGENQVAVDWDRLNVQPNRVTVNMTEQQIKAAPHWRKDQPGRFADAKPLR